MRFYAGLVIALIGPILALLAILYILRHGFPGYLIVFAGLACFGLLIDGDRRRRAQAVAPDEDRLEPVSLQRLATVTRATAPQLLQAVGLDILGTVAAMAAFVGIAFLAVWVSHLNLAPRSAMAGSLGSAISPATLARPAGITLGHDGSLYISDELDLRVDHLSPNGRLLRHWGLAGTITGFRWPVRVATGNRGRLYVADARAGAIDVFSAGGRRLATWHTPDASDEPMGLAVGRRGNVYVALLAADRIEKLSPSGKLLAWFGGFGAGPGQFDEPSGVAVGPSGVIYVLDTLNNRIQVFSPSLHHLATWGGVQGGAAGNFSHPTGIAIDAVGHVYVADTGNHRIEKFSAAGRLLAVWGRYGHDPDQFDGPHGIAVDPHGNVYVADMYNHRIVQLDPAGKVVATYGSPAPQSATVHRSIIHGRIPIGPNPHSSPLLAWLRVFVP